MWCDGGLQFDCGWTYGGGDSEGRGVGSSLIDHSRCLRYVPQIWVNPNF